MTKEEVEDFLSSALATEVRVIESFLERVGEDLTRVGDAYESIKAAGRIKAIRAILRVASSNDRTSLEKLADHCERSIMRSSRWDEFNYGNVVSGCANHMESRGWGWLHSQLLELLTG